MCDSAGIVLGSGVAAGGALLVVGALWKLRRPALFRGVLRAHGLRATWLVGAVGLVFPLIEMSVGASAVVVGVLQPTVEDVVRVVGLVLAVVGTGLSLYVGWNVVAGSTAPCGCVDAEESFGVVTLLRPVFMAASGWAMASAAGSVPAAQSALCTVPRLLLGLLIAAALTFGLRAVAR